MVDILSSCWTLTVPLLLYYVSVSTASSHGIERIDEKKVEKLCNIQSFSHSINSGCGREAEGNWPGQQGPPLSQDLTPRAPCPAHVCPSTETTASATQLNTLQKNKLTADDDLSETGFYPFIHTHNVAWFGPHTYTHIPNGMSNSWRTLDKGHGTSGIGQGAMNFPHSPTHTRVLPQG